MERENYSTDLFGAGSLGINTDLKSVIVQSSRCTSGLLTRFN